MARKLVQLASEEPVDEERLRAVVAEVNPRPKDSIQKFPYFSERYFRKMEGGVSAEVRALGLLPWDESY